MANFASQEWSDGSGKEIESLDPGTDELVWKGHSMAVADLPAAVASLREGQPAWEALGVDSRTAMLHEFVALVERDADELADLVAREVGKPLWEAKTEVTAVVSKLAPSIEFYDRRASEIRREVGGLTSSTRFRPLGVAGVIGPFNFPLSMINTHVMPALLAGNAVAIKPSEQAPSLAIKYVDLLLEAGIPKSVVALFHGGPEVALSLVDLCDAIYLTGSRGAGEALLERANGRTDVMMALEMGGNNPLVVWDYDDIDAAVFGTLQSAYISAGQRCSAARRLITRIDDDNFIARLVSATKRLTVGLQFDEPQPYVGPMISHAAVDRLTTRYNDLLGRGAVPLVGLELASAPNLVRPAILDVTGVDAGDEEHFGPLLLVTRVATLNDAIAAANKTSFGLSAGIYAKSDKTYETFRLHARAGIVNWNQALTGAVGNAPFGGARNSGNFRPGGSLSVDYCVYAVASLETPMPKIPESLPPGLSL